MTIHTSHPDCEYCKKLWDWAFLDECFSNNIRITDIDGFVERNGHYLVIETKSPGAAIPSGQQRMIDKMHQSGSIAVLVVWGLPQHPIRIDVYHPVKGKKTVSPASLKDLKSIVSGWYRYANTEPPPLRQPPSEARSLALRFRSQSSIKTHA